MVENSHSAELSWFISAELVTAGVIDLYRRPLELHSVVEVAYRGHAFPGMRRK